MRFHAGYYGTPPNLNATAEPIESNENKMSCRGQSPAASFTQRRNAESKAFGIGKNFWGAHASSVLVGKPGRCFASVTAASCRNELLLTRLSTLGDNRRLPWPRSCAIRHRQHASRVRSSLHGFKDWNNFRLGWLSDDFDVSTCGNPR